MYLYETPALQPKRLIVVVWVLGDFIRFALTAMVLTVLTIQAWDHSIARKVVLIVGGALLLVQLLEIFMKNARWKTWHFDVGSESIEIMRGIFFTNRTMIPLASIEHVDTTQGPLERMFGLYSLRLATAAGEHGIPGLNRDQAESLRTHVRICMQSCR